jgi:hypothetical protein
VSPMCPVQTVTHVSGRSEKSKKNRSSPLTLWQQGRRQRVESPRARHFTVSNQAVAAISKATAFSIFGPFRPSTDLSTVGDT